MLMSTQSRETRPRCENNTVKLNKPPQMYTIADDLGAEGLSGRGVSMLIAAVKEEDGHCAQMR